MIFEKEISNFNFPINFKSFLHLIKLIYKNKSPIRIFHNYFLKNIFIEGKTIDLGCGNHSSYLNFLKKRNTEFFFADKDQKIQKNYYQVDLEKKLSIKDEVFDTVLFFNVLEHLYNYKNILNEINRILKKNGKLELFVPFMHRYHEDPKDVFRPTHAYLKKLLNEAGFEVKIYLIGVGPLSVCSEILLKYAKFKFLKVLLLIIFILLDKIIKIFSKDHNSFYSGIHCTCEKK